MTELSWWYLHPLLPVCPSASVFITQAPMLLQSHTAVSQTQALFWVKWWSKSTLLRSWGLFWHSVGLCPGGTVLRTCAGFDWSVARNECSHMFCCACL